MDKKPTLNIYHCYRSFPPPLPCPLCRLNFFKATAGTQKTAATDPDLFLLSNTVTLP